ncbi:uncharacterized protein B0I36DRAFT_35418 [Microdochium trichocladiopsis]|uniref:Uncharacterized protein n=1 Tax=Microdochium trichocladiopsis TaxID=1682393 RepID=A0A9P8XTH9_9PEZI|nr:uncharacterized protein B0I36DRAFT_35418 [Microdochium trichocladiopsis]KAH7018050.1 hypothetical protein B0I36DRAFT_35418 [Microdochium trichocladiopsis]
MVATKAGQRRIRLRSPGAPEAQCTTTDMVIHIHHHGGKIWLPRGGNASVPIQSTIQLANGAMIAAADDNPADLIFQTHAIESATPGSKVILLGDAVLKTLPGKPIELLGKQSNKLRLPPGTLLQFGTPSTPHRVVPFGGGSLCSRRMLRDVLTLSDASSVALPQPMTLGPGGFTLQGDMALPQSVILTGNMAVSSGSIILPEPPELDEQYVLEVVIDGLFRETYVPGTQLRNGTVLPWATRLPAGTVLKQGLHIPGGITLPTGTLIPAGP